MRAADRAAPTASRTIDNLNRTQRPPLVIGIADHNGWAVLVSTAALNGEPAVADRRRVDLVEPGVPSQPYHHETLALRDVEAEQLVGEVKRSIAACTDLAFDRVAAELEPQYRICAIAIRHP